MSESLGKGTIDKKSSGETKGKTGSSSRNFDVLGRELLTPDETRKLDNQQCILLIRGCDPIIDNKYNTFQHPLIKESEDGGADGYIHDINEAGKIDKVKLLNEDSVKYYEKQKENGEPVRIIKLSMEEVFSYEPIPEKIFTDEELAENRKVVKRPVKEVREQSRNKRNEKENKVQPDEQQLSGHLSKYPFDEQQLEEIRAAIESGMDYKDVILLADIQNPASKMKEIRLDHTKDTAN